MFTHQIHDNRVAHLKIWSRRSLHRFCVRAQTYGNQSDVFDSLKPWVRHASIRDQNPSLGMICPDDPHQRNPMLQNLRIGLRKRQEWQEQGAREAAWKLAKSVVKLKERNRAAFFSPPESRCLPASNLKLEQRVFVVDSAASMPHAQQKGFEFR